MKILKNEMKTHALRLSIFALATMLSAPALASHYEEHDSGWFEYRWNDDHNKILYCNAIGAIPLGGGYSLHDRRGQGNINGFVEPSGGGIYLYLESNDIGGLQITNGRGPIPDPTGADPGFFPHYDPYGRWDPDNGLLGCPNGDTFVFGAQSEYAWNMYRCIIDSPPGNCV